MKDELVDTQGQHGSKISCQFANQDRTCFSWLGGDTVAIKKGPCGMTFGRSGCQVGAVWLTSLQWLTTEWKCGCLGWRHLAFGSVVWCHQDFEYTSERWGNRWGHFKSKGDCRVLDELADWRGYLGSQAGVVSVFQMLFASAGPLQYWWFLDITTVLVPLNIGNLEWM